MSVVYLSKETVLAIHEVVVDVFFGNPGIIDLGLLDSAVNQPAQAFGGTELYPTLSEKAARLAYGIVKNHAFLDANTPTAFAAMGAFLLLNGLELIADPEDAYHRMIGVADGTVSYDDLAAWLTSHVSPKERISSKD